MVESPNENFRVRKCVINYFLEDDTIFISEPKVENSGIPQSVFLKRHKVPRENGEPGTYTWVDFNAGAEISIYARVYRIVGYDEFTRKFYETQGVELNAPEREPEDNFVNTQTDMKQIPPD